MELICITTPDSDTLKVIPLDSLQMHLASGHNSPTMLSILFAKLTPTSMLPKCITQPVGPLYTQIVNSWDANEFP